MIPDLKYILITMIVMSPIGLVIWWRNRKKMNIKFVSYDGKYPNLCNDTLVMCVNGKNVTWPNDCLHSGGSVFFTKDWNEVVTQGEWDITNWPKEFPEELKQQAIDEVNTHVSEGCCGGCI